jgi:hypothetical protein
VGPLLEFRSEGGYGRQSNQTAAISAEEGRASMVLVTHLVAWGQRLMTPNDKAKAIKTGANDWPHISTASEVRKYKNGLRVKFDRSLLKGAGHTFTVTAINADTGKFLAVRENERRYEDARRSIERALGV